MPQDELPTAEAFLQSRQYRAVLRCVQFQQGHQDALRLARERVLREARGGLGDIHLVDVGQDIAEFVTVRDQDRTRSVYFVYLTYDLDGLWKIVRM
jgi:hypothetical protein